MGVKFDRLEAKLSGEKGVTDPGGLAAAIGRKKYGKENYDKAAAKDKSPKMKKSDWDELDEMFEEVEQELEKAGVKASRNLWGKPTKKRGVGIYGKEGAKPAEAIQKGGVGSGKKGHKTQADLEGLKDNMGRHHIMQYGDKGSAFSESGRQGKSEVFHHPSTDSYHVVSEGGGVKHLKDHSDFKRLGAPYKGDPAAEGNKASREDASGTRDLDQVYGDTGTADKTKGDTGKLDLKQMRGGVPSMHERKKMSKYKGDPAAEGNKASRQDASGTRPKSDLGKSEIELEIDELSKTMEFATMNPVEEIKKAVMELGPEGLRKAMPDMSDENKELLNDILEDMSKSHTLPIDPPKKLVNVGGENYVEEDVMNDDADEDVFDAAVKEGDNEQKHQGGSHDLTQPVDWEGQMIKSLDEFTAEELATFGEIYKAMKMKKEEKEMDKAVSASPKLWGSTKPRGVGIYKGEDDSVADKVKEVEGKAKLNDVMDDTPEDKKDDVLRELREKKMKKAKELIKAALKKECPGMMEEKEEDVEVMKKKIKKALILALNEEYSDEEVEKAYAEMDKGGPGSGKRSTGGAGAMAKERLKDLDKKSKKSPVKEHGAGSDLVAEYNAKMKKAMEMFAEASELIKGMDEAEKDNYKADEKYDKKESAEAYEGRDDAEKKGDEGKAEKYEKDIESDMTDADYDKDKSEGKKKFEKAQELFLKAKRMVADVLEMNPGIKKLSQPEPANEAKTTADAVKSPKMAKSIKWYGEENDAFKAGRLGRHNYASSVNGYYDEMIKKSEVVKEEELKKSFDKNDLNDLIEADMTSDWIREESNIQMEEFKKSQGSFTRKSFEETDLLKSLGITKEEADKL